MASSATSRNPASTGGESSIALSTGSRISEESRKPSEDEVTLRKLRLRNKKMAVLYRNYAYYFMEMPKHDDEELELLDGIENVSVVAPLNFLNPEMPLSHLVQVASLGMDYDDLTESQLQPVETLLDSIENVSVVAPLNFLNPGMPLNQLVQVASLGMDYDELTESQLQPVETLLDQVRLLERERERRECLK